MKRAQPIEVLLRLDLLNRLWQHRRLFGMVFGAVLGLTVFALIVLPVRYLATGSVIVAEQEPGVSNASAAWAQKIGDPADLESQLLVIRSPRVMRLAMTVPGVLDAISEECRRNSGGLFSGSSPSCDKLKTDSAAFIDYVQSRYAVGAVGRSRVINISYQSGLPEVAQTMANALTSAFLDDQRAAGSNSREVAASWLWKELGQLNTELRAADAKIQTFRRTKGLMRGATAPISSERLTSISQQLSVAEAARADAAARLQEIKAGQARGSNDAPAVLSSRAIADLKQQLTVISAQLASSANVLGPKHPSLLALEREQALIQQRLADEVVSIAASAQKAYDANDALVTSLKKQMDAVKSEVGSATSDEASIESMVREAEIKRQQYSDLYKKASELETERRVLLGSTRLVSLAELPNKPFFPKKIPFLAAGFTLALLLAIGAAFLSEQLSGGGRLTPEQPIKVSAPPPERLMVAATPPPTAPVKAATPKSEIARILEAPLSAPLSVPDTLRSELAIVTGVPVLGHLPQLKSDLPESPIGAILKGHSEMPLGRALQLAQQDRALQQSLAHLGALLFGAGGVPNRKILVTSPGAAEGKTFLTLALAQHLASSGYRVLVVECDFQHPAFDIALSLKRGSGLQGVLRGEVMPGDAVARTANANLDAIATGGVVAETADLLLRKGVSDLLLWAKTYDVVLIDGPSSGALSDIQELVERTDGVLLCARYGRSPIGLAVAATSAIKAAGGKLLGLAMTMVKPSAGAAGESPLASADVYVRAT